jgi:hypothetical protein
MSYWVREIAGWLLVLIGLIIFWQAYQLLLSKRIFEAAPLTFVGFIVFRGGVHLLKVAVAAQAARNAAAPASKSQPRRPGAPSRPVGPTPAKSVLPGPQTARPKREPAPAGGGLPLD